MMCTICPVPVASLKSIVYVASEDIVNVKVPETIRLRWISSSIVLPMVILNYTCYVERISIVVPNTVVCPWYFRPPVAMPVIPAAIRDNIDMSSPVASGIVTDFCYPFFHSIYGKFLASFNKFDVMIHPSSGTILMSLILPGNRFQFISQFIGNHVSGESYSLFGLNNDIRDLNCQGKYILMPLIHDAIGIHVEIYCEYL